jgi:hypothetical protein
MQALKDTNKLFLPFVKNSLPLLIVIYFGCELMQHFFLTMIAAAKLTQSMNLPAMFGGVLTSLLEFVFMTMLVPLRVMNLQSQQPPGSFIEFTKKHIAALTAESLRAFGVTMLWLCLFIIPGIYKYICYFFVPYVVVADEAYIRGERDALEYSTQLVKGFSLQLLTLIVLFTLADLARGHMRESLPLQQSPVATLIVGLGFFAFVIYTNILLFRIYQLRVIRYAGAANVSASHL